MEENITSVEPAILARGVRKQYGNDPKVLDNLDMTVIKGTIYSLLGASGCGKTTLLNAILGSREIQSGSISILGKPPGVVPIKSIGYMPQEIALVGELTVKNVIQHQGWIFGMTNKEIEERHKMIEKLLDLPPGNRLIKNLSGGQQRRVSLAVVLIQDPELLILDEPTVGLDPVLRQTLWDYLIKITKEEKKTVVITTHYIEEARQANMLGMLRKGKMLVEGEPQTLMNQFNYNSLEDLFAFLSSKQESMDLNIPYKFISEFDESKILSQRTPKQTILNKIPFTNRGHAKALLSKNFYRYVRHPGTVIIALIFPILQISAVFIAIRIPNDLTIGIVNQELGDYKNCEDYVSDNHTIGGHVVDEIGTCEYEGLGCKFIEQIQDVIPNQIYFESMDEALRAMKEEHIHQVLYFPHNYSEAYSILTSVGAIEDEDFDFSQIIFHTDEADHPFGLYIEKELYTTYLKFTEALADDCQWSKHSAGSPLSFKEPIFGKADLTYADFITPGMMSIVLLGLGNALAVLTIVNERNGGVWERTAISGVKPIEILFCHTITLSFISAIQALEVLLIPHFFFGLECKGKLVHALLLAYSQGLVGVTIGILLSVVSKNEIEAIFGALGISLPMLYVSGFFWPLEGMPKYLKYFCYALPSTIPTESLNNIIFRGWDISNFKVYKGFLMSIVYICLTTILSVLRLKVEKK